MATRIRGVSMAMAGMGVLFGGCFALTSPGGEGTDPSPDAAAEVDGGAGDAGLEGGPTTDGAFPPVDAAAGLDGGMIVDAAEDADDGDVISDGGSVEDADGATDAGPVSDGGSSDAGDAGSLPGVTCTYRLVHTHNGSCDALCGIAPRKPLPPEELMVMEDVPVSTLTASGCAPLASPPQPEPGKRVAEIHADALFDAFLNMSQRFQLTGSPPLEAFTSSISATRSPCVSNPLRTSGTISVQIVDSDVATVDMKVSHAPLTSPYCGITYGCLLQVLECKGTTKATRLP